MQRSILLVSFLAIPLSAARSQEPLSVVERFRPDYEYRVTTRVDLKGELSIPIDKDKPPQRVKMAGKSSIDYDERLLPTDGKSAEQKTMRIYRTIDFRRVMGDKPQEISLRPGVRRLVVMKRKSAKVPFSPDGPLTWGEIDMLRTDVFVPALAGLLPERSVKPGETWNASDAAVAELTDMEKLEEGALVCKFELEEMIAGRKVAHITLSGDLQGVNEDGPNRQKLTGRLYFDLRGGYISYLSINGEHYLLDKDGKESGKISGEFVMVRQLNPRNPELSDASLGKTTLEPNADNTLLLYEEPDLGVRFLHPRRWRVSRTVRGQITLDESSGAGLLITVDSLKRIPLANEYMKEAQTYLKDQKSAIVRISQPIRLKDAPTELDQFSIDIDSNGQKVVMDYLIARQENAGATFAGRFLEQDRAARMQEVERIAASLRLSRKLESK